MTTIQILDRVWIGTYQDATDPHFIRQHNIGFIINTTRHIASPFKDSIPTYRIPIDQSWEGSRLLAQHIPIVAPLMTKFLRETTKSIMIHCQGGICRSATVLAGYLILEHGLSMTQAMQFITSKKPDAFHTYPRYKDVLMYLEKQVTGGGRV